MLRLMRCRIAPRIAPRIAAVSKFFPFAQNSRTSERLPIEYLSSQYPRAFEDCEDCEDEVTTIPPCALHYMLNSLARSDPDDEVNTDVELLIRHGADVNAKWDVFDWDRRGRTPLHVAAKNRHTIVAQMLLDNGADVNAVVDFSCESRERGCTPLHVAAKGSPVELVQLLLRRGADVHAKDRQGHTPLHFAAGVHGLNGREDTIVKMLIAHGADVSAKDNRGKTPLHHAAGQGSGERVKALVDAGADVNAVDSKSRTPLHIAAAAKHELVGYSTRALVDAGADLNAVDSKCHTPLHVVALLHGGAPAHAIVDGLMALKAR